MFSVNSMSLLNRWGRRAVAAIAWLKALAPYAMIELVLPGGSVMALALWLYRRRRNGVGAGQWPLSVLINAIKQRLGRTFSMARVAFVRTQWDLCPVKKLLAMRHVEQSHYRSST
jgi:hypothetical protein